MTTCVEHGHEASAYSCPSEPSCQCASLYITVFGGLDTALRLSGNIRRTGGYGEGPRTKAPRLRDGQVNRHPFEWPRKCYWQQPRHHSCGKGAMKRTAEAKREQDARSSQANPWNMCVALWCLLHTVMWRCTFFWSRLNLSQKYRWRVSPLLCQSRRFEMPRKDPRPTIRCNGSYISKTKE
jgi:hypothetical protein